MPLLDIQNGRKISPRSTLPRALPLAPTLRPPYFVRVSPHSGGFCFSPAALPLWRVPVSGLDRIGGEILPVGLRRFAYAYIFFGFAFLGVPVRFWAEWFAGCPATGPDLAPWSALLFRVGPRGRGDGPQVRRRAAGRPILARAARG